jgi:hypothetical protein
VYFLSTPYDPETSGFPIFLYLIRDLKGGPALPEARYLLYFLTMDEQLEFLKTIARRLDEIPIPYMVSGSVAMNVYAQPRMTRDIDIVVDMSPSKIDRFVSIFEPDCYIDREMVREAVRSRDMFNIIHNDWIIKADFVVRKAEPYRLTEFERRRSIRLDDIDLYVVAPEDLILSKLVWVRESLSELQRRDVRNLLQCIQQLDWAYLERWADALSVRSLLEEERGKR